MKKHKWIFVAALFLLSAVALADPVDNPGGFVADLYVPNPLGSDFGFITFKNGAEARLPAGSGNFFAFNITDGTTGEIDLGFHSFASGPVYDPLGAPLTYGGSSVQAQFVSLGSPDSVVGFVDIGHGEWSLTFEGYLNFAAGVPGFLSCKTSTFTFTVGVNTGLPPGSYSVTEPPLFDGVNTVPVVNTSPFQCDATAAAFLNSALMLNDNALFELWKVKIDPAIDGSY